MSLSSILTPPYSIHISNRYLRLSTLLTSDLLCTYVSIVTSLDGLLITLYSPFYINVSLSCTHFCQFSTYVSLIYTHMSLNHTQFPLFYAHVPNPYLLNIILMFLYSILTPLFSVLMYISIFISLTFLSSRLKSLKSTLTSIYSIDMSIYSTTLFNIFLQSILTFLS